MLSGCRHPRFRNYNSTVPVDVVRVKSYEDSLLDSTRVPVRVSVNKLNFVQQRIIPGLIGVFRNGRSLSSRKSYNPVVLFNPFIHAPSVSPMYTLPLPQGILYTTPSCFRGSLGSIGTLGRTKCYLRLCQI